MPLGGPTAGCPCGWALDQEAGNRDKDVHLEGREGDPTGDPYPAPGSPGQPAKFGTEEVVATWDQERLRRGDIPQGTTQATWPRRS